MNCNKRISSKKRNGQHVKKPRQATNTLSNPHQENSDEGFESLSFPEKEYEMLRTEILQYMEEYQSVRNMMYIATAAILWHEQCNVSKLLFVFASAHCYSSIIYSFL